MILAGLLLIPLVVAGIGFFGSSSASRSSLYFSGTLTTCVSQRLFSTCRRG